MKILVDLSFINSENKIRESVAIYALRVLDGFNEEALKSISILVSDDYKEFFINKYPNLKLEVYPSLKSAIYKIPYMKGVFKMLLWKKIVNYLNYDVVYIPFAWSGNSLAVKSKKIITIHDLKPMRVASRMFSNTFVFKMLKLSFIYLYVSRYFFSCHIKNATKVIAISDYVNNDISKEWPRYKNKIRTIYNGVILPKYSCKPNLINEQDKYLLYVNTLVPYKNLYTLVLAYELIDKRNEYKLVVVGKNTEYWLEIKNYIESKGFINQVVHLNYVSEIELKWLYEHASVFITTSTKEGFGYTPIEAAICKTPVISTLAESLPDVTANLLNYYDPPFAYDKLSVLINKMLDQDRDDMRLNEIATFYSNRYDNFKQSMAIYNLLNE